MKKVHEYDLKGNYLKTWGNTTKAAKHLGCDESNVRKAANRNGRSYCSYWSREKTDNLFTIRDQYKDEPRILVFDIETMPLEALLWRIWKQSVNMHQVVDDWFLASWSAKWLHSDIIFSDILTPEEMKIKDDKRIAQSIWHLLDQADVVIAHNGKRFDIPKLNAIFVTHNFIPPMPYKIIDTLSIARGSFSFTSNKLDDLGEKLGVGRKIEHEGMNLWKRCMASEQAALDEMIRYNIQDVILLEKVYDRLKPYMSSHPNWGLYVEKTIPVCPTCGSEHIEWYNNYYTITSRYSTFRCLDCGSPGRARTNNLSKQHKQGLVTSIPGR